MFPTLFQSLTNISELNTLGVYVVCSFVCNFTIQLAAHQLHAHGAGLATHNRDNADKLGDDWRVKQVGLGAVIVHVSHKYL